MQGTNKDYILWSGVNMNPRGLKTHKLNLKKKRVAITIHPAMIIGWGFSTLHCVPPFMP